MDEYEPYIKNIKAHVELFKKEHHFNNTQLANRLCVSRRVIGDLLNHDELTKPMFLTISEAMEVSTEFLKSEVKEPDNIKGVDVVKELEERSKIITEDHRQNLVDLLEAFAETDKTIVQLQAKISYMDEKIKSLEDKHRTLQIENKKLKKQLNPNKKGQPGKNTTKDK